MSAITEERMEAINRQTVDRSDMFYWQTDRPMSIEECAVIFGERHAGLDETSLRSSVESALADNPSFSGSKITSVEGGHHYDIGSININRNFTFDNGLEVVGRFHPVGLRNGYFSVETAVVNLALENGIPAPKPFAAAYENGPGKLDFVLFEKVQGANMKIYLTEHPEDEPELVRDVGRVMARIHRIKVNGFGFFDNNLAKETGELRGIHASNREHVLAALPQNLEELVGAKYITTTQAREITRLLSESKLLDYDDPRLIHNDFADWNTIVKDGKVVAAIDWDEAFAGDPIADIACWTLFFPIDRLQMLLDGYKEVADLPDDFEERLHIYRLRYTVSKMTLRHKKFHYDKSQVMTEAIEAGLQALREEVKYFNLTA